jgi:hypothetical protein
VADRTPVDTVGLRVTRAELARVFRVSRAAVTGWCQAGKLNVGPDDRIDYAEAVAVLIEKTPPARLRSRWLRDAAKPSEVALALDQAKARVEALEREVQELREGEAAAFVRGRFAESDEFAVRLNNLFQAIELDPQELLDAIQRGSLGQYLDNLVDVHIYLTEDAAMEAGSEGDASDE